MIFWILVEVITKQLDIARAGKRKPETLLTTISRHREVLCFEMTERFSWSVIFFIKRSQRSGEKKPARAKWVQNWALLDFDMSSLLPDLLLNATKSHKQTPTHDRSAKAVKSLRRDVPSCVTVYHVVLGGLNFCVCGRNPKVWPFKCNLLSSIFPWYSCGAVCYCVQPRLYLLNLWVRWFKWKLPGSNSLWCCLLSSSKRLSLCGGISK